MKEKLEIALFTYKKLLDVSKKCADSGDSSKISGMCIRRNAEQGLCHFMYTRFKLRIDSYLCINELMPTNVYEYIDECPCDCDYKPHSFESRITLIRRIIFALDNRDGITEITGDCVSAFGEMGIDEVNGIIRNSLI